MTQPAIFYETLDARLVTGRTLRAEGPGFRVAVGNSAHDAVLAASCLLEPRENDLVLLAVLEDGARVILAVLFHGETALSSSLRLPENAAIKCAGRLTVGAGLGLELRGAQELRLESESLAVSAVKAEASAARLDAVFEAADICCRTLTTLGQTAVSVFRSLTQCLGESRRMVSGSDETRCRNSTLAAEETAAVMSKNSLALAQETARTDAGLIQLG